MECGGDRPEGRVIHQNSVVSGFVAEAFLEI